MYALRYPLCDNVPTVNHDITEPDPRRKVWDFNSPIALFVSKPRAEENAPNSDEPVSLVDDEKTNQGKQETLDGSVGRKQLSEGGEQYEDNDVEAAQREKKFKENTPVEQDGNGVNREMDLMPVAIQMDFLPSTFLENMYSMSGTKTCILCLVQKSFIV